MVCSERFEIALSGEVVGYAQAGYHPDLFRWPREGGQVPR